MDCIFCKIAAGEAPAQVIYRDEQVTAFRDIHPKAPTHILIIPNRHFDSLNVAEESDAALLGHLMLVAKHLAAIDGIQNRGYRLVLNTGPESGETVFHLHLHLIGGKPLPLKLDCEEN
ncbi:MAG: histidine triad nucleotide-binding protein [Anaerolineaceae bacterium]